jgi:tetratricopeptide (TPR) repeat protein
MDALVGVLSEADVQTVGNAARALSNLRPIEHCSDVSRLRTAVRPPTDATTRAQVDGVRERLHRARMLDEAGRYEEAQELVVELEEEATAIGHPPLIAEVENVVGSVVAHRGDWAGSEEHFERAYFTAMGGVHPEEAASAAAKLIKVTGSPFALGRREDGLRWSRHAEGAARGLEDGGVMDAMRLANVGHVLALSRADQDEAIRNLQTAAERLEARLGPNNMRVIMTLNDLAYAMGRADRHEEALAVLARVLEIEGELVGYQHPLVASTRGTIGALYIDSGRLEEGERETLAAMEILERAQGHDHPNVSSMLVNLADVYEKMERNADMIAAFERAVAIRAEKMGPGHPIYLWTLGELARVYLLSDRPEDALSTAERALREAGDLPPDHRHLRTAHWRHAESLIRLGRGADALAELEALRATIAADEAAEKQLEALDALLEEARAAAG